MKKRNKFMALSLAATMMISLAASQVTAEQDSEAGSQQLNVLDTESPVTLVIYGPGVFGDVPEEGALSAYTGEMTMGWGKIVERWNELHPNVTLDIQGIGWTDWVAAVQAAVLGGDVDIIGHGGALPVLCEPLDAYLEADPDIMEMLYSVPMYYTEEIEGGSLSKPSITSIPFKLGPGVMVINTRIFEDYGVDLPDASYTWEDVVSLASQLTGTDPVTGEQTYGYMTREPASTNLSKSYQVIASAYDAKAITYGTTVADSTVDFTSEGTAKVFQTMADLAEYCSPDNVEGVEGKRSYGNDNAAMTWSEGPLSELLNIKAAGLEEQYMILPMPAIEAGEYTGKPSLFLGDNNLAISKMSKNKEWAWEFIKFLVTDEIAVEYAVSNGMVWNTQEGIAAMESVIDSESAEVIKYIMENIPENYSGSTNPYYDSMNFGSMSSYISAPLWELLKNDMTVEQAQENVQQSVDDYFATLQ